MSQATGILQNQCWNMHTLSNHRSPVHSNRILSNLSRMATRREHTFL